VTRGGPNGARTRGSRGGPVLIGALAVDSLGNGLFLPLSLIYFVELTDVPLALVGVLLTIANAVTLPIPVWAGTLADRFGALPLVVGAQLLQAAGFLAYAGVSGPVGILVSSALVAIGVRFFWSAVFTAIADLVDGTATLLSRDTWYALANGARTAGLAVGGLVTGLVVADGRDATYRAVAYAAAACFTAAAVLITAFVRTGPRRAHEPLERSGYATLLRDRPFLSLIGLNSVYALSSMMLGVALPTVVLTGIGGPAWLTSVLLAGNAVLIAVLSAPVVARLGGLRRTRCLVVAAALWAAWCASLAVLGPGQPEWVLPVLVAGTLLFTAAELVHAPVSMGLAAAIAPPAARGRYLATFQYSFTISSIVAPAFFATLFELAIAAPWIALGALELASIAGVLALERRLPADALRPVEDVRRDTTA
jgi:MFS family permease